MGEVECHIPVNVLIHFIFIKLVMFDMGIFKDIRNFGYLYVKLLPFLRVVCDKTALVRFLGDDKISLNLGIWSPFKISEITSC